MALGDKTGHVASGASSAGNSRGRTTPRPGRLGGVCRRRREVQGPLAAFQEPRPPRVHPQGSAGSGDDSRARAPRPLGPSVSRRSAEEVVGGIWVSRAGMRGPPGARVGAPPLPRRRTTSGSGHFTIAQAGVRRRAAAAAAARAPTRPSFVVPKRRTRQVEQKLVKMLLPIPQLNSMTSSHYSNAALGTTRRFISP